MKGLSLVKTNYGNHRAEESECKFFGSLDGWRIDINESSLVLAGPEGKATNYDIHLMESDFVTDTWLGTLRNGSRFRIVRPNQNMLPLIGDTSTFASVYHDGYAVHYNLV